VKALQGADSAALLGGLPLRERGRRQVSSGQREIGATAAASASLPSLRLKRLSAFTRVIDERCTL
jgi:hypothetical protein